MLPTTITNPFAPATNKDDSLVATAIANGYLVLQNGRLVPTDKGKALAAVIAQQAGTADGAVPVPGPVC